MTALADRLLVLLGDDVGRACLRALLQKPRPQNALVQDLGLTQSVVSRALGLLRAAGWVEADGLRAAPLRVRQPEATRRLLLAADHLADELIRSDAAEQQTRTKDDRRALLDRVNDGDEQGTASDGRE